MSYYIPIHIHTDFSIGDALLGVDEYVKWAKDNNYPSIAITDHGNLCASLYFNQVANKAGIKSIIGIEAYCAFKKEFESQDKEEKKERDHFVILAKNYQGYLDLCWLLGQAMRNTFYYKPIILYEELVKYNKNLIVSSACMGGRIPKLVLENKEEEAIEFIDYLKNSFGDDFYLEVMEVQMPDQTAFNQWVINNYKRLGIKVIWTTDTHYFKPEHAEAHDVMKLINSKGSFNDPEYKKRVYSSRNLWLKKREDIVEEATSLGYDINIVNEFLDNTLEIDSKIEKVKLTRAPEVIMPRFGDNAYEILEKRTFEALKEKGWDTIPEYVERVKTELEVIKFKKMEDYFLIVADIVNFSETNGVLVGCGRGSAAGSLVVHLLGITKINPIKYGLYFERFLNVKRLDPPDIDLDFDSKVKYKIEEYLKGKYGLNSVSHVISFGTFGIKNAIRDTFRVYFDSDEKVNIDRLSKCLENDEDNFDSALGKMVALEGDWAAKFIESHKKQYDIARILVGKNRHYSMHASGIIIAPDHLEKYIPIMRVKDQIATGYPEGGDVRLMTDAGLMKFDILGLNACTIINDTLKNLNGKITMDQVIENDNDTKALEQFTIGNTFSIFQFEGKNITKFVKRAKPTKFSDLVAINALYRPAVIQAGGLEMYLKNKKDYDYEKAKNDPYESVLSDSYGMVLYQESSMRVFQELGGFTLAEADESRHVFKLLFKGRTDYTEFNHMMDKFREGCHKNTKYDDKRIEEIMDTMKNFSKYSFNRSHSCAYAMVAYIMMYLRTYHPLEYFSSLLSNTENTESMQDGKKINLFQHYVTEIQRHFNVKICKPDINESGSDCFRIKEDGSLVYALGHIKDVGSKAAVNIEQNQPYISFKDFLGKVTRRVVNKRVIKALVYSEAIKFEDTAELFKKEIGEEIDTTNFLQRQFEYTSLVLSKDLREATDKEYSLKGVEKAALQGKTLSKRNAIPIIVFISKFRRLAGNSKKTKQPYIMNFAAIYDGTTKIDDCILNDVEGLEIAEGDLVSGKLHFEEAKNKKYSDHVFYLSDIKKIKNTEKYDALSKFNIEIKQQNSGKLELEHKLISRKKRNDIIQTPSPKLISRKKQVSNSTKLILISRKKIDK
ncbi:MAG: DNA polymerase III subunit alpha [Candidatus Nanoarchaeia archaeon]|nr:DNA polymerase III subunit alpha [Candidatus Nanoarchaeia archaeon]